MDIPQNAMIIGVTLRELEKNPPSKYLFADVILIDKSHKGLQPLLYEVEDTFMMMGEVINIDKKKKQIILSDNTIVSYNHLILATGLTPSHSGSIPHQEFTAGLNALLEAIKIRNNLPKLNEIAEKYSLSKLTLTLADENSLIKIVKTKISGQDTLAASQLGGIDRRLYEVQL